MYTYRYTNAYIFYSPPGSYVHGILQARILECVAIPSSRGSSQPGDRNCISCGSCITSRFFPTEPPGKPIYHIDLVYDSNHWHFCDSQCFPGGTTGKEKTVKVLVPQLCPTICDPMDCSPPGLFVQGILQARILEWFAIPYSRISSQSRDRTQVPCIAGGFCTTLAIKEVPTCAREMLKI